MLSIIVCSYRNPEEVDLTLTSIAQQADHGQEVVIIDGGSEPDLVARLEAAGDIVVSEPDNGLYSAMNKGLRAATKDFVVFMNAGDRFYSPQSITQIHHQIENDPGHDLYIFRAQVISETGKPLYIRPRVQNGRNFSHQAMAIRRSLHLDYPYDEAMRIAGDVDVWRRLRKDGRFDCSLSPEITAYWGMGGRSSDMKNNVPRFVEVLWSRYQAGEKITGLTFLKLAVLTGVGQFLRINDTLRHTYYTLRNRFM